MRKFYCYVDETGQHTLGVLFIVVLVFVGQKQKERLSEKLLEIENRTQKRRRKWKDTKPDRRVAYIEQISQLKELQNCFLYAMYQNTRDYYPLIASTIAQGLNAKLKGDYSVNVYIDGFPPKQLQRVRKQLKRYRIHYNKIKGVRKEENNEFIRLADAIAGLVSHWKQGRQYVQSLFEKLRKQGIIAEIKNTGLS